MNPSLPEIMSAAPYAEGVWVNDWNGINGPGIGSKAWTPEAGKAFSGEPPTSSMGVGNGAYDFIQKQYMVPPYHDESNNMIMPEQLCFTVNYADPTTGSVVVMTLPKVNQTLHEEHLHFERSRVQGNPEFSPQSKIFYDLLNEFGEKGLAAYERASSEGRLGELQERLGAKFGKLEQLHRMSLEDDFHWLTMFGLLRHITFAGVVINTNRATGLETMDRTLFSDHYTVVNVCLAKRVAVANVFGTLANIKTGSKLWLILKRKNKPNGDAGELVIIPGGSHIMDYPMAGSLEFNDIKKDDVVRGHFWRVGVVLRQADTSPAEVSIQRAANIGLFCNERGAYEAHGTLPTMWIALGIKY